jgi:hypothetical protein
MVRLELFIWNQEISRTDIPDVPPENDEPPPPFPFPTSSSSRLPPTFTSQEQPPIPNSPPPGYELASAPPIPSLTLPESETNRAEPENRPPSRTSTRYESAPSSPVIAPVIEGPVEDGDEDRNDRRMWNEDLLAGYSLEERVQREFARRGSKELGSGVVGDATAEGPPSPVSELDNLAAEPAADPAEAPAPAPAPAAVEPSTIVNEPSNLEPTPVIAPLASPTNPPAKDDETHVEPTVAKDSSKVEMLSNVESDPDAGSPVVPSVELDTSSNPTDDPAESSVQERAVSETPTESQEEVEHPSQRGTVIHTTPPPVDSTPPKVPEVSSPITAAEPAVKPEITAPTPRPIPSASKVSGKACRGRCGNRGCRTRSSTCYSKRKQTFCGDCTRTRNEQTIHSTKHLKRRRSSILINPSRIRRGQQHRTGIDIRPDPEIDSRQSNPPFLLWPNQDSYPLVPK